LVFFLGIATGVQLKKLEPQPQAVRPQPIKLGAVARLCNSQTMSQRC
jgi:hypothetical protein